MPTQSVPRGAAHSGCFYSGCPLLVLKGVLFWFGFGLALSSSLLLTVLSTILCGARGHPDPPGSSETLVVQDVAAARQTHRGAEPAGQSWPPNLECSALLQLWMTTVSKQNTGH